METQVQKPKKAHARKCDDRCWNAESDHCSCECEGKNHGKNLIKQSENYEPKDIETTPEIRKEQEGSDQGYKEDIYDIEP